MLYLAKGTTARGVNRASNPKSWAVITHQIRKGGFDNPVAGYQCVIVTIGNNRGIITGKFFDYLGIKKPILCISEGKADAEIRSLFMKYNLGLYYATDGGNPKEIEQFLIDTRGGKWQRNEEALSRDFSWKARGRQLSELMI